MIDFKRLAKTTRSVAENMPLYRAETRSDLLQVADFLDTLTEPDPTAASTSVTETSLSNEVSGDATEGPVPQKTLCHLTFRGPQCLYAGNDMSCDHTFDDCRRKFNTHNWQSFWPESVDRPGPAIILKLEESDFE